MRVELNAERVRALREEQGMTKRDLARRAGVSTTTARKAESGEPVRSATAKKMARALGVDPLVCGGAERALSLGETVSFPTFLDIFGVSDDSDDCNARTRARAKAEFSGGPQEDSNARARERS